LLLQLDSTKVPFFVNFGDAGIGYLFLSADGQTAKFLWQCARKCPQQELLGDLLRATSRSFYLIPLCGPRASEKAAEGRRTPGRFASIDDLTNSRQRLGLRQPSGAF
jgi:hypothetical protein